LTIKVLLPTDAQNNCFERILKNTSKKLNCYQLMHKIIALKAY